MKSWARWAVILSAAVSGLAACEDGMRLGEPAATGETAAAPRAGTAEAGVRDVERPDIFETTEEALWDGRPSLGGIWIAHPDVQTPERAILINESNGQRVAGALFRRERDNPGPNLQLSSDAAAALGILAGQPTEVTVIAVRQEEVEVEPAPPVISDEEVGEEAPAETAEGVEDGAAEATGATEASRQPNCRNFFQRTFNSKCRAQNRGGEAEAEGTADSAAAPDVETQVLDPVATGAAAAIARAEADDKPAPRPARQPDSGLRNPYIQVGLFSVEENAAKAGARLRGAGIVPSMIAGSNEGELFWRVVVGPIGSAEDQSALLAQVRELGFSDAFLAPN